jgi:hypothetical protein
MSRPDVPDKFDVELVEVPAQVRSVFPRRTKVTLRNVAGRVGVYRTGDDGGLLGLLNSDVGLDTDADLGRYLVEIRSVRRAITDAADAASEAANAAGAASGSGNQYDAVPHAIRAASVGTGCITRILVRVTRQLPERRLPTPNDAVDGAQNGAHPDVVEADLSRLADDGVELFSEDDLRRFASNAELRGALGPGSELVQWVNRLVEARTFDEKRAVVRDLMGPSGGRPGELIHRTLHQR